MQSHAHVNVEGSLHNICLNIADIDTVSIYDTDHVCTLKQSFFYLEKKTVYL